MEGFEITGPYASAMLMSLAALCGLAATWLLYRPQATAETAMAVPARR